MPPASFFRVHNLDARKAPLLLAPYSSPQFPLLTTTITSPPYGRLKDYGAEGQIGYGQPHDEYLIDVRRVFRTIADNTRRDGSMWVVADTVRPRTEGIRPLRLLPFELVAEAEAVGWTLRDIVIWSKDKSLPWSGPGRFRNAFEYILFFVKGGRFKFHLDRVREPSELQEWWVRYPERYNPRGKAPSNLWTFSIPVQGSWSNTGIQHACPLPPNLVERLLLLSTDAGDVVFDPFAGSGVVVAEAERLDRRGLGIELNPDYVTAFEEVVRPAILGRPEGNTLESRLREGERLRATIWDLRIVKFARVIARRLSMNYPDLAQPRVVTVLRDPKRFQPRGDAVSVTIVLVAEDAADEARLIAATTEIVQRPPASKFGVRASIRAIPIDALASIMRGRRLYGYLNGRTHRSIGRVNTSDVKRHAALGASAYPVIVSNVFVDERPRALPKI